jgi:hypothetical protein
MVDNPGRLNYVIRGEPTRPILKSVPARLGTLAMLDPALDLSGPSGTPWSHAHLPIRLELASLACTTMGTRVPR